MRISQCSLVFVPQPYGVHYSLNLEWPHRLMFGKLVSWLVGSLGTLTGHSISNPSLLLIHSPLFPHPGVKSPRLGTKWSSYCRRASSQRRKLILRMNFIVRESPVARRAGMMGPWGRRAVETARWVSSRMGRKASLPKLGEEWHVKRQLQVEDQKDTFEQNWFSDFHRFSEAAGKLVLHHVTSSSIVCMPREWALEKAIHVLYHWDEEEVHQDYNNKAFF